MAILTRVSEKQVCTEELWEAPKERRECVEQITKLKEYAMDKPGSRAEITTLLESYTERYKGTVESKIAARAVAVIKTISMLEILQGDGV